MTGLVWFVQCIHYPLIAELEPEQVPNYQKAHIRRTFPLIPTVMLVEGISGTSLLFFQASWLRIINLSSLVVIWLLTFLLIVPVHQRLCGGFDSTSHQLLLRYNGVRSFVWLLHACIASCCQWTITP